MSIRAWICSTTETDYLEILKRQKAKVNDIVIVYNPAVGAVIEIGGYRRKTMSLPRQLTNLVSAEIAGHNSDIKQILATNSTTDLDADAWTYLRDEIIKANPDLEEVVKELESSQNVIPKLEDNAALLVDLIWNAIQLFGATPTKSANTIDIKDTDAFKKVKQDIISSLDENSNFDNIIDTTMATLEESGLLNGVSSNDPNLDYMTRLVTTDTQNTRTGGDKDDALLYLYKTPRLREENVINRDMASNEDDLEIDPDYLVEYRTLIKKVIDPDGRELYVLLTHRRGQRNKDVLGSDFVYMSALHQSFVFVQYKMFDENQKASFTGHNQKQLDKILQACKKFEGCPNRQVRGGLPLQSIDMRLGVCSFFYKLCDNTPVLPANRNTIVGYHLPACFISQLCQEAGSTLDKKTDLTRHLTNSTFVDLTKKGLIGTSKSSFEDIANAIREGTQDDLVLIAIETTNGQILPVSS